MNFKEKGFEEILLFLSLLFFVFFISISIAISQFFLFLSFVVWCFLVIKSRRRIHFPKIFIPIVFYSILTIISAFLSIDPHTSLKDIKELLLFLIVPVIYNSYFDEKPFLSYNYALSLSIFLSFIFSLAKYSLVFFPQERASGFLGHYMTQAGLLLLFLPLSFSMILGEKRWKRFFWTMAFIISSIFLMLTLTRSAWVGTFFALFLILLILRPKLTAFTIPAIILIILFSPLSVKKRFMSIFDPYDETNRDRIHMGIAGAKIIYHYPFFGSGPDTVRLIYKEYKPEGAIRDNPHLHNNILQITAERGIFALISWLWFMILATKKNFEVFKKCSFNFFKFSALGALGVIAGLFISGLFEYNFGDSEVKMLFLYLITYPMIGLRKEEPSPNFNERSSP